jgi:hypothetical protein
MAAITLLVTAIVLVPNGARASAAGPRLTWRVPSRPTRRDVGLIQ